MHSQISQMQQWMNAWTTGAYDHAARTEVLLKEMAGWEKLWAEKSAAHLEEAAKLSKESLEYAVRCTSEFRTLTAEMTKRMFEHADEVLKGRSKVAV